MSVVHQRLGKLLASNAKTPEKKAIQYVDMTPDEDLPLRILRAYRHDCDMRWDTAGLGPAQTLIYEVMNDSQGLRAEILDRAIAKLQQK